MISLKVKSLRELAKMVEYKTAGAACMDIAALLDAPVTLYNGHRVVIPTGLAFEVPAGYVMQVFVRSSLGFKYGIQLANGTGIIDSDYRGEVKVCLINLGEQVVRIEPGDRIAQAMLVKIPDVVPIWVDGLDDTERGEGGFGSTGQ